MALNVKRPRSIILYGVRTFTPYIQSPAWYMFALWVLTKYEIWGGGGKLKLDYTTHTRDNIDLKLDFQLDFQRALRFRVPVSPVGYKHCFLTTMSSSIFSSSSSSSCSWRVRHVILFLDPQDEAGPSISSSVVPCFFVLLVYIVVLVLLVCLCPSSVYVVATFPGTVLFPLLCSVLQFLLPNTSILFFIYFCYS